MNGEQVGRWTVDRTSHTFTYAEAWLASDKVRSLSLSLPITGSREIRGEAVANYFENLLPDNEQIRQRLSRRFRTKSVDAFDLLTAIGRDCVGAVQLLPDGAPSEGWDRIDGAPLTEGQVADILRAVPSESVLGTEEDGDLFRISMAGAQEKTALLKMDGQWSAPHGATPTTHIFKLPLGLVGGSKRVDLSDSVQNEWLCAQLLTALGLPVATTTMERFEDQLVLISERFDREWMDGRGSVNGPWIARLPQEDFCQALGVHPDHKYEQHGGPSMEKCLQLLGGSADAAADKTYFLLTQLAFWLMAATDGHAKNYSIFLLGGDDYTMTPLYDVLSMWPYIGTGPNQFTWRKAGLAMAVRSKNAHYTFHTILTRHWHGLAMKHGGPAVWQKMLVLVEHVEHAIAAVQQTLPSGFPEKTWSAISEGMRAQAKRFDAGLASKTALSEDE